MVSENPSTWTREPIQKWNGIWEVRTAFTWKASLAMISRPDFYLANPPSQPKAEIADYVEQNWILVPRRFKTLKEALASWKNFIIRSEHPEEYNWASGLLESFEFNIDYLKWLSDKDIDEIKGIDIEKLKTDIILKRNWWLQRRDELLLKRYIYFYINELTDNEIKELLIVFSYRIIKRYCEFLWKNIDDFIKWISFSYWELLDGYNRSIIADSSVKWRYHIFTHKEESHYRNYVVWDNWVLLINWRPTRENTRLNEELSSWLLDVIEFYEQVRNLENFNPNHCPIVEFQTFEWQNYFLQYHRTRNFENADFILDRPLEEWEIEAEFVRGVTPQEWIEVDFTVYDLQHQLDIDDHSCNIIPTNNLVYDELVSRKIPLHLSIKWLDNFISHWNWWHLLKSTIFKPWLKIVLPEWSFDEDWYKPYYEYSKKTWKKSIMRVRIVSDWRKAYFKILWNNLWES